MNKVIVSVKQPKVERQELNYWKWVRAFFRLLTLHTFRQVCFSQEFKTQSVGWVSVFKAMTGRYWMSVTLMLPKLVNTRLIWVTNLLLTLHNKRYIYRLCPRLFNIIQDLILYRWYIVELKKMLFVFCVTVKTFCAHCDIHSLGNLSGIMYILMVIFTHNEYSMNIIQITNSEDQKFKTTCQNSPCISFYISTLLLSKQWAPPLWILTSVWMLSCSSLHRNPLLK